eukprot:scaffold83890_cov17-Prasinocladus_malaysianus.AAC.3
MHPGTIGRLMELLDTSGHIGEIMSWCAKWEKRLECANPQWQNLSCHRDPLVLPKSAAHVACGS